MRKLLLPQLDRGNNLDGIGVIGGLVGRRLDLDPVQGPVGPVPHRHEKVGVRLRMWVFEGAEEGVVVDVDDLRVVKLSRPEGVGDVGLEGPE